MVAGRRLRIHGRVQGVGFRAFVYREAQLLGVEGWVRNRTDGTVEALVWGEQGTIETFLGRINEGPRWGRVDRMDVTIESESAARLHGFNIRSDR